MNKFIFIIVINQIIRFLYGNCSLKSDCYDVIDSKCKQIDGLFYIGREKQTHYCMTDLKLSMSGIEYCQSKMKPVCMTKDQRQCIIVQNNPLYVAILQQEQLCVEQNEVIPHDYPLQKLQFIKEGYCQNNQGVIIKGKSQQGNNSYFLCNQSKENVRILATCSSTSQCLKSTTCKNIELYPGKLNESPYTCVVEDTFYPSVICSSQYCKYKNSSNEFTCYYQQSTSPLIIMGKRTNGNCAIFNSYYTESSLECNPQYCKLVQSTSLATCLKYDSQLVLGKTDQNNCVIGGTYYSTTSITCKPSYCIYITGQQATCLSIEETSSPQLSGYDQDGNCILENIEVNTSIWITCRTTYCRIYTSASTFMCIPFDGSPNAIGRDASMNCTDLSTPTFECYPSSDICHHPSNNLCYRISAGITYQDFCVINGTCGFLSTSGYIGRDTQYRCLTNQQIPISGSVDRCYYSPNNICLKIDRTQCILYRSTSTYLGYIQSSGNCAELEKQTSTYQFENVLNLSIEYCQNSNYFIKKIELPNYVGRDKLNYRCLSAYQIQFQEIQFCISGYCTHEDSCKPLGFNINYIAILSDGSCGIAEQQNAIQCAFQSYDVCYYNNACYWLQEIYLFTSGVNTSGQCLERFDFSQNFRKCESNHCKIKSFDKTKTACYLVNGQPGLAGFSSDGSCMDFDESPAIKCTDKTNTICYDPNTQQCKRTINYGSPGNGCVLNRKCQKISNNQYIGRDRYEYQCLTHQQQAVGGVSTCFDDPQNICLVRSSDQFCVIYPQTAQYLGYIVENKECAQLDNLTYSFGITANLINLRLNYCQDYNGFIRQIESTLNVGVDSYQYLCLAQDQITSTPILQCFYGFCINVDKCQLYDYIFIGRNSAYQCLQEGEAVSVECSKIDTVCYDPNKKACYYTNDNDPKQSGRIQNGQCAVRYQYYPIVLFFLEIILCSINHCKEKQNPNDNNSPEGCFPFDESIKRVGIDKNGYCVYQDLPTAVRCMKGQFCLDNLNEFRCKALVYSKDFVKFSRQKVTGYCLPFIDSKEEGDSIETCVTSTCIYTNYVTLKDYCFPEGTLARGDYIVGIDINGYCILQDELTSVQIISCLGVTYCILDIGGGQSKCQLVQEFDSNYPTLIYKAKNINQRCQDLNIENSIGCMDGLYCLNKGNNKKCEAMISQSEVNKIGRDLYTQECLPQGFPYAGKCLREFCIVSGVCEPLSSKYPGKEETTHKCLTVNQSGNFGASNCYTKGYCLIRDLDGKLSCNKLMFSNINAIGKKNDKINLKSNNNYNYKGVEKDTQMCLKQDQAIAVMCATGQHCLDPITQTCIIIDTSIGMCTDSNGVCTSSGACKKCNIDQCLSLSLQKSCEFLVQSSRKQCTDKFGFCAKLNSQTCVICPDSYCMINNSGNCVTSIDLLQLINGNSCFIQKKDERICVQQNIDNPDSNGNLLCTNSQSFCQNTQVKSTDCLLCPKYYSNPGTQKCYSLQEKSILIPNSEQLFFEMKLTYVKEDCYDQTYCQTDISKKCPIGCYSCNSVNFCTKCVEGYFLFEESSMKQICIKCSQEVFQYREMATYYSQIPTYKCLGCSAEYGQWQETTDIYKTCTNYQVFYGSNSQIMSKDLPAINFIVDTLMGVKTLVSYDSILCPLGCKSCIQDSKIKANCVKCDLNYFLNDGNCEKCPDQCEECEYATFQTGYAQLKSQMNYDTSQQDWYNFKLICLKCKTQYIVSYDLSSCQKCREKCSICQYENDSEVLNINQSALRMISLEEFKTKKYIKKCTQCNYGYFLSENGESCIKNINNCNHSTTVVRYGSQDYDLTENLWIFLNGTPTSFKYICKQCKEDYRISKDGKSCLIGCKSSISQFKCQSCYTTLTDSIKCLDCINGMVLNNIINPPKCQDDLCKSNNYGCQECFLYYDNAFQQPIYQCTKCINQYAIPTVNGCISCPIGCTKCYEGTRAFNYTSELIHKRNQMTIQQRLDYNNIEIKYDLICEECAEGYYFDQNNKQCQLIKCGQYCQKCILVNNKPKCITCNNDSLMLLIQSLTYFIGRFYFQQNNIPNFSSIVSFTPQGDNCQVCPIMCQTCLNDNDLSKNPLLLYDSQCLSCKQTISPSSLMTDYKITYDKERRKCYLCQSTEQGCYFKKQRIIYTKCLDTDSQQGDGSFQNPVNFNRLNEINIDKLILDELEYQQAIVYYNELQVKELQVTLIFLGDECTEKRSQVFKSSLKDSIRSLEKASLNITSITAMPDQIIKFYQQSTFVIQGFDQVKVQKVLFQQQNNLSKIGLSINDKNLSSFEIYNCQFLQLLTSNEANKQYLNISLSTIQKANLLFQNIQFKNIYIKNHGQLIQVMNLLENSQIDFKLEQVSFINVLFDQSTIISLNMLQIKVNAINTTFYHSTLNSKALLFDVEANKIANQAIEVIFENITFTETQFFSGSQILNSNFLVSLIITNIKFNQCSFYSEITESQPLILSNTYLVKGFNISKCLIKNQSFLQQQDSKSILNKSAIFSGINILENEITTSIYIFLKFSTASSSDIVIDKVRMVGNKIYSNNLQSMIELSNLYTIKISEIQMIDNNQFLFLKVVDSVNIYISKVLQDQSSDQVMSPFICQLNQIQNYISIFDITQSNCQLNKNSIDITSSLQTLNNPNYGVSNQSILQGVSIGKIQSTNTTIVVKNTYQLSAPISIVSKQQTIINIFSIQFSNFKSSLRITNIPLGLISQGFYLYAPHVKIEFKDSKFIDLDQKDPFHWILGLALSINFQSCNFVNNIGINWETRPLINTVKKGGFVNIFSETIYIKNSKFVNGLALYGGALYWTTKQRGNIFIQNSTFEGNSAYSNDDFETEGGALFIDGYQSSGFDIKIQESFFTSNIALYRGGAIQFKTSITPRSAIFIEDTTFYNNLSLKGSNIQVDSLKAVKTIVVLKKVISLNEILVLKNKMAVAISFLNNVGQQVRLKLDKSLFSINNAYEVTIQDSKFKIKLNNTKEKSIATLNNLIFQKIFYITNINTFADLNNFYEESVFQNNLITIKSVIHLFSYNITIQNNQNINEILTNSNSSDEVQSIINYEAIYAQFLQLYSFNNQCQLCNKGIIKIDSLYLKIQDSNFQNNIANCGSGLYITQLETEAVDVYIPSQKIFSDRIIQNSKFKNNLALVNGGAVYVQQSSILIQSTLFYKNKANDQGGSVYLDNSSDQILHNVINLTNSTLIENNANYGGVIGSNTGQSINKLSNNTLLDNKAIKYGNNINVSPSKINVYVNGIKRSTPTNELNIQDHQGGYFKDDITLRLSNNLEEEIIDLPSDLKLKIRILNGYGYLKSSFISHKKGIFNVTKQIEVYGLMDKQLQFEVSCDLIQTAIFDNQEQVIQYDQNYTFLINIQLSSACPVGKIQKKIYTYFDQCSECKESSYSFQTSNTCQKCPNIDIYCKGNQMLLSSKYWRVNQISSQIYDCKNCVGDYKLNQKINQSRKLEQIILTDQNYYCAQGYIGALCEDCDRSGKYWGQRYFMDLNEKCQRCDEIELLEIIYPISVVILIVFVLLYLSSNYQEQTQKNLLYKILLVILSKPFQFKQQNNLRIIKFFLNQSSIIGLILSYETFIPNFVQNVFIDIGNLLGFYMRVAECFLEKILSTDIIVKNCVLLILVWLSVYICFLFICLIKRLAFNQKYWVEQLVVDSHPNQIIQISKPNFSPLFQTFLR